MRVVCIILNEKQKVEDFAEACFRFTPQIAIGDSSVFLEITGCHKLFSESTIVARLQVLLKRFQLKGPIAIAGNLPTAISLAHFRVPHRDKLPIEALPYYFSPFKPTEDLEKVIIALRRLGIVFLNDLRKIPRKSIVHKLGKEVLLALHHMDEAENIIWPKCLPKDKIIEHEILDDSYRVQNLEPLLFLLKRILDRSLLRLRGKGHLASEIKLVFEQKEYSVVREKTREWVFSFSFPQGSVHGILPILRERLDRDFQRKPLESEITRMELEILRSVSGQFHQADFFCKREQDEESFRTIVARFTDKLGPDKVFYAEPRENYFPERSWRKTLLEPKSITSKIPERPLRLLKTPTPLHRLDSWLIHGKRRWQVLEMDGPEHISGDWWFMDRERDYYRVVTASGEELWVFSHPGSGELFLHGIFD